MYFISRSTWEFFTTFGAALSRLDFLELFFFVRLTFLLSSQLINWLTHSTEQLPSWEPNRFSASQEISRILWNPKADYRIHKSPSLSWERWIQSVPPFHIFSIHFNIILPSSPRSYKWSLSLRSHYQNLVLPLVQRSLGLYFICSCCLFNDAVGTWEHSVL